MCLRWRNYHCRFLEKIKRNWDDEHLTCDREHAIWASRLHILHQFFREGFWCSLLNHKLEVRLTPIDTESCENMWNILRAIRQVITGAMNVGKHWGLCDSMVNARAREIGAVCHGNTWIHANLNLSFFPRSLSRSLCANTILWLHNSVNKWGLVPSLWHFSLRCFSLSACNATHIGKKGV